jgi:hypothetical protein
VPDKELDLEAEAEDYARRCWAEEYVQTWDIGRCDVDTRAATIFAVEDRGAAVTSRIDAA